jgi:hypothetical protein
MLAQGENTCTPQVGKLPVSFTMRLLMLVVLVTTTARWSCLQYE